MNPPDTKDIKNMGGAHALVEPNPPSTDNLARALDSLNLAGWYGTLFGDTELLTLRESLYLMALRNHNMAPSTVGSVIRLIKEKTDQLYQSCPDLGARAQTLSTIETATLLIRLCSGIVEDVSSVHLSHFGCILEEISGLLEDMGLTHPFPYYDPTREIHGQLLADVKYIRQHADSWNPGEWSRFTATSDRLKTLTEILSR